MLRRNTRSYNALLCTRIQAARCATLVHLSNNLPVIILNRRAKQHLQQPAGYSQLKDFFFSFEKLPEGVYEGLKKGYF
jgi:hypothetical protein